MARRKFTARLSNCAVYLNFNANNKCCFTLLVVSGIFRTVHRKRRRNVSRSFKFRGFSLIELMITIAVAAILLSLAAPSFTTLLRNSRMSSKKNEFVNGLNLARTTALAQNAKIKVCPFSSAGSATCGSSWSNGWIIETQPATGNATLIKGYQSGPKDPSLSAVAFNGIVATDLVFDPNGLSTTQSNFKICDARGANSAVSLQVLLTGFIQAGPTPGQAVWGGALTCP